MNDPLPAQLATQLVVAMPFESVITPIVFVWLGKWHDGPVDGAVKSTRTPGAGTPEDVKTDARIVAPCAVAWIVALGGARTAPKRTARMR